MTSLRMYSVLGWKDVILIVLSTLLLTACGGGGGKNKSEKIGPVGGTATSGDGKASVTIPADALSNETAITVAPASNPPAGNIGTAYEFGPSGTTFNKPVTISIGYDEAALPSGVAESDLRMGTAVNGQWQAVSNSNTDTTTNIVTGTTDHFSIYAVVPSSLLVSANAAQLNTEGLELLNNKNVLGAKDKFKQAVEAVGTQTSSDADTARFFYALTRIGSFAFDLASDGNSNDLNRPADFLDRFGCSSSRDPFAFSGVCPKNLSTPSNVPAGNEFQTFLQNVVLPEVEAAIDNLNDVSSTFNLRWTEPISNLSVESDYGDVLAYRAALKSVQAQILAFLSYNLEGDINSEVADPTATAEARLARHPDIFKPNPAAATNFPLARTLLQSATDDLIAAVNAIQAETDSQADDLVNLNLATPQEIAQEIANLEVYRSALFSPTTVYDNGTPSTSDDLIVNGNAVFTGPFDIRDFSPPVAGDVPGLFPDATFGGAIIQGLDVNTDVNPPNGRPDLLE